MRSAEHTRGAKTRGLETGHAGLDAEFFGDAVGGNDNAIATPAAADPDGPALQFGIEGDFAACKKAVGVHMQDAIFLAHARQSIYAESARRQETISPSREKI